MLLTGLELAVGSHFLCVFGGQLVNATRVAGEENTTDLHCHAPPIADQYISVPVEVSLNGQNFTTNQVQYGYYRPPYPSAAETPEIGNFGGPYTASCST